MAHYNPIKQVKFIPEHVKAWQEMDMAVIAASKVALGQFQLMSHELRGKPMVEKPATVKLDEFIRNAGTLHPEQKKLLDDVMTALKEAEKPKSDRFYLISVARDNSSYYIAPWPYAYFPNNQGIIGARQFSNYLDAVNYVNVVLPLSARQGVIIHVYELVNGKYTHVEDIHHETRVVSIRNTETPKPISVPTKPASANDLNDLASKDDSKVYVIESAAGNYLHRSSFNSAGEFVSNNCIWTSLLQDAARVVGSKRASDVYAKINTTHGMVTLVSVTT